MQALLVEKLFQKPFLTSWLFVIEIIARMNLALGLKEVREKIYELPLNTWVDIAGTKIKFFDMIRVPFQLLRIAQYYYKKESEIKPVE